VISDDTEVGTDHVLGSSATVSSTVRTLSRNA